MIIKFSVTATSINVVTLGCHLSLFFFLFSLSRHLCLSLHKAFSISMKNGRRLSGLSFFSMDTTDSIILRQAKSASTLGLTEVHSLSATLSLVSIIGLILAFISTLATVPFIISWFYS